MHIVVINSGSSSLKFSIFHANTNEEPETLLEGQVSGIGSAESTLELRHATDPEASPTNVSATSPVEALHIVLDELARPGLPIIDAIGYRIVHPGPKLDRHQRITDAVLADLEAAIPFAPLHNPDAIRLIRAAIERFPSIPHYACFDTVFHQTMPPIATTYPIPMAFHKQGVRRYGFHGLSCESVVRQLRNAPGIPFPSRLIIAHLGSGCSISALRDGESVDNTMGLTPTGGIVMGSRPGDLDPGLIFYLLRQPGATIDSVEQMLNHNAGLHALGGSNDLRELRKSHAELALDIFSQSIRRALGGMVALHGLDAIVFTGGIGQHDHPTHLLANNLIPGTKVDPGPNQQQGLHKINTADSTIPVYIVPAQEDLVIALHVARLSASKG